MTGLVSLLLYTYKISETLSIHIFITPSSPASPFVPSLKELECAVSCSFSTAFFLGIIIRNNSLSFFHIDCSYFPLLHSSQYIYPGHKNIFLEQERMPFIKHRDLLPWLSLFSNCAFFSSTSFKSPQKNRSVEERYSEQTCGTLR